VRFGMDKYTNPFSEETEKIAIKFDDAIIARDSKKLHELIDETLKTIDAHSEATQAKIFYFIGTAIGEIDSINKSVYNEITYEKQIFYFRKSISIMEKAKFNKYEYFPFVSVFKCTLYTNYANALNQVGRMILAIEFYKKALIVIPSFGIALGQLGKAYQFYGNWASDQDHQLHLHHCAYTCLFDAINVDDPNMYSEAKDGFKLYIEKYTSEQIEKVLAIPLNIRKFEYEDKNEFAYREWVLKNNLFLNPLNDLPYYEFAYATDSLRLPPITTSVESSEPPDIFDMFNQLKQEYIFARYQYYCGLLTPDEPHFADKDTGISYLLDYQQYSIRIEHIKSSFKTLYSLLDKVGFFVNEYFDLGIQKRDVSFSNIWKIKKGKEYEYKNTLKIGSNYAIDALWWIRKDFYIKFHESPYPHAKRVSEIRNALEHRYSKIYMDFAVDETLEFEDEYSITISEEELKNETLRLLKLVREVIIYLSMAVGFEEYKNGQKNENKLTMPMMLNDYDDEWKL
jgi:hypothetical protein